MTRQSQKDEELRHARQWAVHVPELSALPIVASHAEPPDVRVGDRIGIEITRYLRNGSPRDEPAAVALEIMQNQVTRLAEAQYQSLGGAPVGVSVFFATAPIPRSERRGLATSLAEAVRALRLEPGVQGRIEPSQLPAPAARFVRGVSVHGRGAGWDCGSGFLVDDSWDGVIARVRDKEGDLGDWPAWATERWCLVVAPGEVHAPGGPALVSAGILPQPDHLPDVDLETPFDRVYFLDALTDYVRRLA